MKARLIRLVACLCFVLLALMLSFSVVLADATAVRFQELKKQYMSLRNTDIALARTDEWDKLARQFEGFVDKNPSFDDNPSALLNAATLVQILYQNFGGADRAQKAASLLERIARDYPGHHLVDDALLKRGDLLLFELRKVGEGRRAYEELVRAYPKSELVPVARSRIKTIDDGSYRVEEAQDPFAQIFEEVDSREGPVVVIDPGHGGEDFGAQGVAGLLEKDVVLAVAFELEQLLKEKLKAVVRLTRRSDIFVPLAARTQLANDFNADMFISLHTNASPKGRARGFEIYYLDNTGDQASQKLAERENASTRFEGAEGDLQFMLSDLIQNAKLDDSIVLGNVLHRSMKEYVAPKWPDVRPLGVKRAPFYVLVGAHMPCVLVEMFFIDNVVDGPRLAQKQFRSDLAKSLFLGIEEYYEQHISRATVK